MSGLVVQGPICLLKKMNWIVQTKMETRDNYLRVHVRTGNMIRHFPVRSRNIEQTGKVWENHTKYWKTQGNLDMLC